MRALPGLIALALLALLPRPALACGDNNEQACGGNCEWYVKGTCPFCLPWCARNPLFCHAGNDLRSGVCHASTAPPPPPPPTPAIAIEALPSSVTIDGGVLTGLQGFHATVKLDRVDFVTPDSAYVSPNNQVIVEPNGTSRPRNCTDIGQTDANGQVWKDALLDLTEWHRLYPAELLINANWFDVASPFVSPNVNLCTNLFGLSVRNGQQISAATATDRGNLLDSLLMVVTKKGSTEFIKAKIVGNAEIAQYNTPQFAVSGFVILKGGAVQTSPSSNSPGIAFSRTAVGLSEDGQTMTIIVEQRGKFLDIKAGLTAAQMAGLLKHYGASSGLNLDNSGSSHLVYYEHATDTVPKYESLKGDDIDCSMDLRTACTAQEQHLDDEGDVVSRYRPVPNFLGIKAK